MSKAKFQCDLGGVVYPVYAGDIFKNIDDYVSSVYQGKKVIVVVDEIVHLQYGNFIYPKMKEKYDLFIHIIKGGKESKTISSILKIFNILEDENFSRDSLMIGIGGGVIGDMAGFASSCWYRGMKLLHIPTTLLSAVDSCLGGKTAINLNDTVNAIGSYHHPVEILIDTNVIKTLPKREISSGMGEVIKYAVIHSKTICDFLEENNYQEILNNIDWLVIEALKNKEYFVRGDIKEGNKRLYLNFGHTLGHAIEFATVMDGEETLRHGEAVGLGMIAIFRISIELGYLDEKQIDWLQSLLHKFNLPTKYSANDISMDRESLLDLCMTLVFKDKKRNFERLRLIILTEERTPAIHETNDMKLLRRGFEEVICD